MIFPFVLAPLVYSYGPLLNVEVLETRAEFRDGKKGEEDQGRWREEVWREREAAEINVGVTGIALKPHSIRTCARRVCFRRPWA